MKDEEIKINKDELLAIQLMESMDEASDEALASLDDEGCAHACKDLMDMEMALAKELHPIDSEAMLREFHARRRKRIAGRVLYAFAAAAAVACLVLVVFGGRHEEAVQPVVASIDYIYKAEAKTDIQPPSEQTVGDGNEMVLLKAPYGKTRTLFLPDGSEVMLNAGSRIAYPKRFAGDRRVVSLWGEAFFKVTKNAHRPFVVRSGSVNTTVLGTQFSVRHYANEEPKVVLLEGKVMLSDSLERNRVVMKPGQSATLAESGVFALTDEPDMERTLSWTSGYQYYDDITLERMLEEVGRWYNVDVICLNQSARKSRVHFYVPNGQTIEKTVEMINRLDVAYVTLEKNRIAVR